MDHLLPNKARELCALAEEVGVSVLAPLAPKVDRDCEWPATQLAALGAEGLMGLLVPRRYGGHEQGLLTLAAVCETLGRFCSSTAMCFAMHCVGTAVIAAKTNDDQGERYLRPIAMGNHITTLALSEPGTGAHFYLPETRVTKDAEQYVLNGEKRFVTNGGEADSYVISTGPLQTETDTGEFNCLLVDRDTPGLRWLDGWNGLGLRGNSSRGLALEDVRVPVSNRLGEEGDETWYVFEVVAPYFLMAMSGTYLGISQAALDYAVHYVQQRTHSHSGETLAQVPITQRKIAEMWAAVRKARALIYAAGGAGDAGNAEALTAILTCKAEIADTVVQVTNEAMNVCGGIAFAENSLLARLLRDGRAAHVMSPTTEILRQWVGRSLLGQPLL